MTCPAWANEKATIRRLYPHVGAGYIKRRHRLFDRASILERTKP